MLLLSISLTITTAAKALNVCLLSLICAIAACLFALAYAIVCNFRYFSKSLYFFLETVFADRICCIFFHGLFANNDLFRVFQTLCAEFGVPVYYKESHIQTNRSNGAGFEIASQRPGVVLTFANCLIKQS